ncbi:GGDEF domain-containing protein [Candidatus Synechococcus calcipolaris G9]|uniref:GGDEF domain-containing protein n=1 Tax=Candidatus Synechococcus calcipolaris G9 TaxID=1497997 RepID=A0ABT6F0F5_9SYNE|nr:GGDEF domain-containing protein [Candidatus Synechococcus calcipolaris]MDG2991346.1 GGDEF domain-containing protein [Candidatus Synechococcus calcipolaris G9]
MPHGSCFFWDVPLTTLHASGDIFVAIAYFSIPLLLLINRHYVTPDLRPTLFLFAGFILSCGIGHGVAAWNIWHSDYWLEGSVKIFTAGISLLTAWQLSYYIPIFLRTRQDLAQTQEQVFTDALTGIGNRRGLDQAIGAGCVIQTQSDRPCRAVLMLMDLDNFKQINDTYGHPVGDQVLQQVAELLNRNTRSDDYVGRIGGDEFALLISGCDQDQAQKIAQKLQRLICNLHVEGNVPANSIHLGVSIGIIWIDCQQSPQQLYRAVDAALYQAKRRKNSICWAQEVEDLPDATININILQQE